MTPNDAIIEEHEDEAFGAPDIVEWYEARPITVPSAIAAGTVLSAFVLGAVTAAAMIGLFNRLER